MKDITDKYIRKRIEGFATKNIYTSVSRMIMRKYILNNVLISVGLFIFILIVSIPMEYPITVKILASSIILFGLLALFNFSETLSFTDKKAQILFLIIKQLQQARIQPYQLATLKDITALEASIVGTKTASPLIIITTIVTLGPVVASTVHPLISISVTIVLLLILFNQILQGYADALIRQAIALYEEQQALLKDLLG
ncbi:hypothetical protein [Herpetosiphon llansteffanensis]|uniref:hypothetical protein n=1 Tax=Herpetosiphon llansteffanensis TaxID=2094568 RepID=UPI000F51ADF8|nr:hypothetical protein [Herpetosiphon llansteffanensis]